MRIKPAFNGYKADYERICPICQTVIFSKYKSKKYCGKICAAISHHINSIKKLARKKNIKLTFNLESDTYYIKDTL